IQIDYRGATAGCGLVCNETWRLHPTDELLRQLCRLVGVESVEVLYTGRNRQTENQSTPVSA
ncbi:MAG: hypothetical protein OQL20_03010, partial [Sedimenticola sp.]|nr:hypothetical protein [Sedimenticola sp.]